MNAADVVGVVGYIYFGDTICNSCADGDEELLDDVEHGDCEEGSVIFAQEDGWEEMVCDSCGETLGDVEGVGT